MKNLILWGSLIVDNVTQSNYSFSFANSNGDVILGLTIWQYWWWFWFTFYICLYYVIFSKLIRQRTLKFSPRLATSQKAHGKWGDFIICFVPIAWCTNILSNSNFILRMLEWQTETSLFTVRVRGRQWYWVYKIELRDFLKLKQHSINVGHDRWSTTVSGGNQNLVQELNELQLRAHKKETCPVNYKLWSGLTSTLRNTTVSNEVNSFQDDSVLTTGVGVATSVESNCALSALLHTQATDYLQLEKLKSKQTSSIIPAEVGIDLVHTNYNINVRNRRLPNFGKTPHLHLNELTGFNKYQWVGSNSTTLSKPTPDNLYLVIKQKRFAPAIRRAMHVSPKLVKNYFPLEENLYLNSVIEHDSVVKWATKRLKMRSPATNLINNRRLLRTRRTLVLPTNVNITVITNSFDVVHSWYIPGLGIKLDCIPGRSTHHTLYLDQVGFYYGQCAEICGRYHHHMPIRVCALPMEHFLIWWYHYGLPYFNNTGDNRKMSIRGGLLQFS